MRQREILCDLLLEREGVDVEQVLAETVVDGQAYSVFVENNRCSRPGDLRRLSDGVQPLGIIWSAKVTITGSRATVASSTRHEDGVTD